MQILLSLQSAQSFPVVQEVLYKIGDFAQSSRSWQSRLVVGFPCLE